MAGRDSVEEWGEIMTEKKHPAPPGVLEERDRVVTRFGNSEIIQTRDGITIQERCRSRPDSE